MADYTLDGITLPGDLEWADEYRWSRLRQSRQVALQGTLIVQQSVVQGGRPITLETRRSGDRVNGPVTRAVVDQLRALEDSSPAAMTLATPDGREFTVAFRPEPETAVEADMLLFLSPAVDDDWYSLTLRLIEL